MGYFGYVAFCDEEVMGDILMNFRPTIFSEAVKMGFVLSVAVSFPLVIFPCRASLYTLLFSKVSSFPLFCMLSYIVTAVMPSPCIILVDEMARMAVLWLSLQYMSASC